MITIQINAEKGNRYEYVLPEGMVCVRENPHSNTLYNVTMQADNFTINVIVDADSHLFAMDRAISEINNTLNALRVAAFNEYRREVMKLKD